MIASPHLKRLVKIALELTKSAGFPENLCRTTLELAANFNNMSVFGQMSMKLATTHKKPADYQLMQAHATFMQSKEAGAMPQLVDMAAMFAAKYLKDGHMESTMQEHRTETGEVVKVPPQYFV